MKKEEFLKMNADNENEIDEVLNMIEGKMSNGVSRLLVSFTDRQEAGTKTEWYHHGRCDVKSPWANGTAPNACDIDIRD